MKRLFLVSLNVLFATCFIIVRYEENITNFFSPLSEWCGDHKLATFVIFSAVLTFILDIMISKLSCYDDERTIVEGLICIVLGIFDIVSEIFETGTIIERIKAILMILTFAAIPFLIIYLAY